MGLRLRVLGYMGLGLRVQGLMGYMRYCGSGTIRVDIWVPLWLNIVPNMFLNTEPMSINHMGKIHCNSFRDTPEFCV